MKTVWYICRWREMYEPDDARRKGSRTALQFVKQWVRGDNETICRQEIEATRRAILRAGGRDLWALWSWIKIAAADHRHFRGYLLDVRRTRAATCREVAEQIGIDLTDHKEVSVALKKLQRLGLVEKVEPEEVFDWRVFKQDDKSVLQKVKMMKVDGRRNLTESDGIIPPNSADVTRPRAYANGNGNGNPPPDVAGGGQRVIEPERKREQERNGDPPPEPAETNANANATATVDANGIVEIEMGPETEHDDPPGGERPPPETRPRDRAGTEGQEQSRPPSCPDNEDVRGRPPPPEIAGVTTVPQAIWDAEEYGRQIFTRLRFPPRLAVRERLSQVAAIASKWAEWLDALRRAGLGDDDIVDFAERRISKACHLAKQDLDTDRADEAMGGHPYALACARARIWMADLGVQAAKWLLTTGHGGRNR